MKVVVSLLALGILMLIVVSGQVRAVMPSGAAGTPQMPVAQAGSTADHAAPIFAEASSDSTKKESGGSGEKKAGASKKSAAAGSDKLDRGIGPITTVTLDSISDEKVNAGKTLFASKCTVCHQLDTRKVGPPLRDVAKRETPEFIMNMILNPNGMEAKDATVKKLISQYQTYMSISGITQDQARALLEYLRWAAEQK